MGTLIHKNSITDPTYYFEDAYYSRDGHQSKYIYKWPNPSYPYSLAIHEKEISNSLKIKIRKWIEHNLEDTVICVNEHNSYRVYFGEVEDWDSSYEVNNRWTIFNFENEQSAFQFNLVFSEYIRPRTIYLPDHPEHIKHCDKRELEKGRPHSIYYS
jgi:hypothetical protein